MHIALVLIPFCFFSPLLVHSFGIFLLLISLSLSLSFFLSSFRPTGTGLNGGNEAWSPTSTNVPSETPSHNASSYQTLDTGATKINNQQSLVANQVPPSNALHNTFLASSVRDSMDIGHTGKISNHHQLRNNLLSSSVRDIMSTLSNRTTGQQLMSQQNSQQGQLLTSSSSQGTYGPLIVGTNGTNRDVYDSTNGSTGPTCLVRSQSGSRFVFSSSKSDSGNGLPPSSYGDHNSIIIRPPGQMGTAPRLTIGGKIIGPGGRSSPSSGGFSSFSSSFPSRFSKSLSHITCNWRCTTLVLLVISLLTFFALTYTINYRQVTSCSCPLIVSSTPSFIGEGGANILVPRTNVNNNGHPYNNQLDTVNPSSSPNGNMNVLNGITSAACPILCSGRGQYLKGICKCPPGWKGKECELREDECEVADCSGHGICTNGRCNCSPGFTGTNCEIETCPTLCSNRGLYDKGTCKCNPGFKGKDCELRSEECSPANCSSHGTCVNGNCVCNPGWKGPSCSQGKLNVWPFLSLSFFLRVSVCVIFHSIHCVGENFGCPCLTHFSCPLFFSSLCFICL